MDTVNPLMASLFHYGTNWNIILIVIGGCSMLAVAIFLERLFTLRRSEVDTNSFLIEIRQVMLSGGIADAMQICEKTGGTIANIVKSGLARHDRGREQIEGAMEVTGLLEIAKLERNAKVLSVIAHIAPLIGLLGTVLGFIQAFSEMRLSGLVDISATRIGEALEYALVTTAAGLVVAIPCTVAYNYLVSRVEGFILEIQATSSEVVDLLMDREISREEV